MDIVELYDVFCPCVLPVSDQLSWSVNVYTLPSLFLLLATQNHQESCKIEAFYTRDKWDSHTVQNHQ